MSLIFCCLFMLWIKGVLELIPYLYKVLNNSIYQRNSMGFSVFALMMFWFSRDDYSFHALGGLSGFESLNPKIHVVLKFLKVSKSVYVPAAHKMT